MIRLVPAHCLECMPPSAAVLGWPAHSVCVVFITTGPRGAVRPGID
jgi:hypothetical protein